MYNQQLINVLLKILGWLTIIGAVILFASGFFVAAAETVDAIEAAGYWIGYEVTGLSVLSFFYVLLGTLHKINNK